jgi:aminoglycoside phosphotransferase (APT) family kinase protein
MNSVAEDLSQMAQALNGWLQRQGIFALPVVGITELEGGKSNPTYLIEFKNRKIVLRRRPLVTVVRSAHAIDREFQVLSALHPAGFAVPEPIAFCSDDTILGTHFYLMEFVEGRALRNGKLPSSSPSDRSAIYGSLIANLAALHRLDICKLGLKDYGKPGSYYARQISRWGGQQTETAAIRVPTLNRLKDFLAATIPPVEKSVLVHGDYRIDNVIFDPNETTVLANIDWELSTIGDPLADLSYFLLSWLMPIDGRAGLVGANGQLPEGVPPLEVCVELYCELSGLRAIPSLDWHFAYNFFRLACIVKGVLERNHDLAQTAESARIDWSTVSQLVDRASTHARRVGFNA